MILTRDENAHEIHANDYEREIYLPGQTVPPGCYREIESDREVFLLHEDTLPASLNGRVACYERVRRASEYYLG